MPGYEHEEYTPGNGKNHLLPVQLVYCDKAHWEQLGMINHGTFSPTTA